MGKTDNDRKTIFSLTLYLARSFLLVIVFVYVSELAVDAILQKIHPFMLDVFKIEQISYKGNFLTFSFGLLLRLISYICLGEVTAFAEGLLASQTSVINNARLAAPPFIAYYGEIVEKLYFGALAMLIIFQIVISIAPYIIAGIWYIRRIVSKMEDLLALRAKELRQVDMQRNLLFSDITHDIKTPITTIAGYSQALADGMISDPAREKEYLRSIHSKSMRISELITMLFEFVKLDSAGFTFHMEDCDLAELVRENVIMVYADFEERGIEIDFDITDEPCPSCIDRLQISRVVTNLLTNSIRYIGQGRKVLISLTRPEENGENCYLIRVADDGIPISREFAETIFDPFTRSDEARQTTSGGSGLGLSIAHKVAEGHGGSLILNLDYGHGYAKAFEVRLPLSRNES